MSFQSDVFSYRNIKEDECIVITYDNNNGGIDWDRGDKRIVFQSQYSGSSQVYFIDLMNLKYNAATKGFYTAEYINNLVNKNSIYVPLTDTKDTAHSMPKWSMDGARVLSIGSYNETNEVFITNRTTFKTIGTKVKNISSAHWKSNKELFIVKKDQPKRVYSINLKTLKDSLIVEADTTILGISKQKSTLYLACDGGVLEYKLNSSKKAWFAMHINGHSTGRLKRLNFVVKTKSGEAQIADLNNRKLHPLFVGEGDGSPVLSRSKKFVAFYSSFLNGIVIKKLNRKF